ncbi:hypothetical protein, partial [Serratia marcescens]|uniref:hypothetical protein n=1 Tax=Serratia marcescens TaxID=615 RepID=UPI0028131967
GADTTTNSEFLEMKSMFKVMMEQMIELKGEVHALKASKGVTGETSTQVTSQEHVVCEPTPVVILKTAK